MQLGHFAPHWILFSSVRLSLFGRPDSAATETYPTARERSLLYSLKSSHISCPPVQQSYRTVAVPPPTSDEMKKSHIRDHGFLKLYIFLKIHNPLLCAFKFRILLCTVRAFSRYTTLFKKIKGKKPCTWCTVKPMIFLLHFSGPFNQKLLSCYYDRKCLVYR